MARWCTKLNIFLLFDLFILMVALVCVYIFLGVVPLKNMKFHVTDGSLTRFNLTSTGDTLDYNLAVNITVRNSNKKIGIWYDKMESGTNCYGKDMGLVLLTPFRQGHKNTTSLRAVFQGKTSLQLQGSGLTDFNNDQRNGSYSILLTISGLVRLRWPGGGKSRKFSFKVNCGSLKLPLLPNSSTMNQTAITALLNKRCKVSVKMF